MWDPLGPTIHIPTAHHWGGVNDRFAYGPRAEMSAFFELPHAMLSTPVGADADWDRFLYGTPMAASDGVLASSVTWLNQPINSEKILCYILTRARMTVGMTPLCIQRMRDDSGNVHPRDLDPPAAIPMACVRHAGLQLAPDYEHTIWADRSACAEQVSACVDDAPNFLLCGQRVWC